MESVNNPPVIFFSLTAVFQIAGTEQASGYIFPVLKKAVKTVLAIKFSSEHHSVNCEFIQYQYIL